MPPLNLPAWGTCSPRDARPCPPEILLPRKAASPARPSSWDPLGICRGSSLTDKIRTEGRGRRERGRQEGAVPPSFPTMAEKKNPSPPFSPPAFAESRLQSRSSGQGKPWQPLQLPFSRFIAFHVRDREGFGKFRRSGAPSAGGRGILRPPYLLSPSHPSPSQSKPPPASFPNELGSSSRDREDPVGSVSWGWACRHQDRARYMAEHQHLLDVGSRKVQPGQGEARTAWTSPWEDQRWSREPSRLAPGEQRACSSQEDNVSKSWTRAAFFTWLLDSS